MANGGTQGAKIKKNKFTYCSIIFIWFVWFESYTESFNFMALSELVLLQLALAADSYSEAFNSTFL